MTRIEESTSSRPGTKGAAACERRGSIRALLVALPIALLLVTAIAAPVLAATTATTESGYKQKPPVPKEKASSGTAPAKEATEPSQGTAPAASSAAPAASSSSTLPFTGLDLRWIVGGGVLLIGAGISIRVLQRR
jgi:hypothetical protein